jgi:hypothetical protein
MTEATLTWSHGQARLSAFAGSFTRRGVRRFAEGITAMALNVEEHTITQSVLALEQPAAWKALETFAEYGGWHEGRVTHDLTRLIAAAPGRIWHGYQVSAVADTKVHRSGSHVWGTGTSHESTARCPNRAGTVRAPNGVVLGAVLHEPKKPGWFRPIAGRLDFRQSQLPTGPGGRLASRTKCELAVELSREQVRIRPGKPLGLIDGGYAPASVVRPRVLPEGGAPRVDVRTRSRRDARLYAPPPERRPAGRPGPKPKWGRRLPPPRRGGYRERGWRTGSGFIDGREREVRWKEVVGLWRVPGHEVPVKAVVAQVEGSRKRFTLVTSAVESTGLQMVELFAARFRQGDGFRDLKQRLGREECRAWTKDPIERTSQAQWVAMSLRRRLQFRPEGAGEVDWWFRPPWHKDKDRPSVRDAERLMRRHAAAIRRLLSEWLGEEGEAEGDAA